MIKLKIKRRICKTQYKVLKRLKKKQVERIEDLQPDLKTNVQDLERPFERTNIHTPTKDLSKEVGTSSVNDHTLSILSRRRFREKIISGLHKDTQTLSSLKNLCGFSPFVSLIDTKDVKEAIK